MKKTILLIMDGFGYREEPHGNAIIDAHMETFTNLWNKYPHSILQASGPYVGLPEGQMGTSEVGHMNIGSGRIALQPLEAINNSIKDKSFFKNIKILEIMKHVKENNSNLHIMGLLNQL